MKSAPSEKHRYRTAIPVLVGLGLLVFAAYLDNIRGPLLPVIAKTMGFSYSGSSFFLIIGHICAACSAAVLLPLLNRFTERRIARLCIAIGIFTCGFGMFVSAYWQLLIFAGLIGICAAVLGTMSNVIVIANTPAHRANQNLALLHVMYGAGSTLGTFTVGQILGLGWQWSLCLAVILPLALWLLWQAKHVPDTYENTGTGRKQALTLELEHWTVIALFSTYVAGEVLTSMWMTSYLVEAYGLSIEHASRSPMAFFLILALTRAAVIWIKCQPGSGKILTFSLLGGILCAVAGLSGWRGFLPFVGILGPFFPMLMARASILYPARNRSIAIYVNVAMHVTLGCLHFIIGLISSKISLSLSYWLAPACLLVAAVFLFGHLRLTRGRIT